MAQGQGPRMFEPEGRVWQGRMAKRSFREQIDLLSAFRTQGAMRRGGLYPLAELGLSVRPQEKQFSCYGIPIPSSRFFGRAKK
jgi:hypothetical protein